MSLISTGFDVSFVLFEGNILSVRLRVFCDYLLSITEIQVKGTPIFIDIKNDKVKLAISVFFSRAK